MTTIKVPAVPAPPTLEQKRDYARVADEAVRYLRRTIGDHPEFLERIEESTGAKDPLQMLGRASVHMAVETAAAELQVVRAGLTKQAAQQDRELNRDNPAA